MFCLQSLINCHYVSHRHIPSYSLLLQRRYRSAKTKAACAVRSVFSLVCNVPVSSNLTNSCRFLPLPAVPADSESHQQRKDNWHWLMSVFLNRSQLHSAVWYQRYFLLHSHFRPFSSEILLRLLWFWYVNVTFAALKTIKTFTQLLCSSQLSHIGWV